MRKILLFSALGLLFFSMPSWCQTWSLEITVRTDTLERLFCPVQVSLGADNFGAALPAEGTPLYSSLTRIPSGAALSSQAQWSWIEPGEIAVMWVERLLAPSTEYKYTLTLSTEAASGPAEAFREIVIDSGLDIYHGDRPVYQFRTIYDPDFYGETRKPYNHVYGTDGGYITHGIDGDYPHQAGIFCGWSLSVNGAATHGYWTDGGGTVQIHQQYFPERDAFGPVMSRKSELINWQHNGVVEAREIREVTAWWVEEGVTILDYHYVLYSPDGSRLSLEGESAHAGMQFRAHQDVYVVRDIDSLRAHHYTMEGELRTGATYVGPSPWIVQLFPLRGVDYAAMLMDDSTSNPHPDYGTRNYGRFGAFFLHVIEPGDSLHLYYRFLFTDRSVQDTAGLENAYPSFGVPLTNIQAGGASPICFRAAVQQGPAIRCMAGEDRLTISSGQPLKGDVSVEIYSLSGKRLDGEETVLTAPVKQLSFPIAAGLKGVHHVALKSGWGVSQGLVVF